MWVNMVKSQEMGMKMGNGEGFKFFDKTMLKWLFWFHIVFCSSNVIEV